MPALVLHVFYLVLFLTGKSLKALSSQAKGNVGLR